MNPIVLIENDIYSIKQDLRYVYIIIQKKREGSYLSKILRVGEITESGLDYKIYEDGKEVRLEFYVRDIIKWDFNKEEVEFEVWYEGDIPDVDEEGNKIITHEKRKDTIRLGNGMNGVKKIIVESFWGGFAAAVYKPEHIDFNIYKVGQYIIVNKISERMYFTCETDYEEERRKLEDFIYQEGVDEDNKEDKKIYKEELKKLRRIRAKEKVVKGFSYGGWVKLAKWEYNICGGVKGWSPKEDGEYIIFPCVAGELNLSFIRVSDEDDEGKEIKGVSVTKYNYLLKVGNNGEIEAQKS